MNASGRTRPSRPSRLRSRTVSILGPAIRSLPRREVDRFVQASLATLDLLGAVRGSASDVAIVFVRDSTMRSLNRRYRGRDRTTDVLTFEAATEEADSATGTRPLGEIVISIDQARRQAREERHSLPTEIRFLLLHGIIHALGYDHETDRGEMNELELRARARLGL